MPSLKTIRTLLVLATLLLAGCVPISTTTTVSGGCEEDLAEAREELNATRVELDEVTEERDDYAQRLEDSTMILIIALFLLAGSYVFFYINTRRAKIALLEYQKRMGIDPGTRPKRRRRG
jgi:hypothetical protein